MDAPMGVILHDEEFLPAAFNLISWAKKSIFISSFKIEITSKSRGTQLKRFFDLLADKARDKVDVRVLINKQGNQGHVPSTNAYAVLYMKRHRIKVRVLRNSRICHAKLIIVDNECIILGSHNLSVKSCHNNFEVSYSICHSQITPYMGSLFLKTWYDGQDA